MSLQFTTNKTLLSQKLTKMLQDGPTKCKIVADFDATLSAPGRYSSWCVVENNPSFSEEFRKTCVTLFTKYFPKESDPHLDHEERMKWMVEWWLLARDAISRESITRRKYEEMLGFATQVITLRQGCSNLFSSSNTLNVPLLVFSAGIGDVIDSILLHHFSAFYTSQNPFYPLEKLSFEQRENHLRAFLLQTSTETHYDVNKPVSSPNIDLYLGDHVGIVRDIPRNVYIIANHFEFTTNSGDIVNPAYPSTFLPTDVITGFRDERIFVFNKHEQWLKRTDYYSTKIAPRDNAIVLGDSIGDALMVAPDSTDNVIRVGILNLSNSKTIASHLDLYLAHFDIVFVDSDGGIDFCNEIMSFFEQDNNGDINRLIQMLLQNVEQV